MQQLLTVLGVLLFCAQQEITFRGDDECNNCNNFVKFFSLLSLYSPHVSERLNKQPKNATLLSPDIQNELFEEFKQELLERIKQGFHSAMYSTRF